jgi:hypothetical protein
MSRRLLWQRSTLIIFALRLPFAAGPYFLLLDGRPCNQIARAPCSPQTRLAFILNWAFLSPLYVCRCWSIPRTRHQGRLEQAGCEHLPLAFWGAGSGCRGGKVRVERYQRLLTLSTVSLQPRMGRSKCQAGL